MNKMKKLLSVLLAVIMALSCMTVMASAAKTSYQTVANLEALGAYSPYGQVTRLSTEERTSIVLDALDNLLPTANINMGEVFNVLGLSVTIDLTSVDRLCYSFDTIKSTFENVLAQIAMGIVNLGILESLETGKWTSGMTRAGTAQYTILSTILNFLSDNTTLVGKVFTDGLDLGIVSLGDMSAVTDVIGDLPGLIKGLVFGLIERWDDNLTTVKQYDTWSTGNGNVETAVNFRVKKLFTDNMSNTTVKYDANGTMTSEHTAMPIKTAAPATGVITDGNAPRLYYHVTGTTPGSVMTIYHLVDAKEAKDLAKTPDEVNGSPAAYTYFKEAQTYVLEQEVEGSETYVWKAYQLDKDGNFTLDGDGKKILVNTLKWYNDESPLLPGFDADIIKLSDANVSAGDLLYSFIPTVFDKLATVVVNGSLKKILAEFFGAQFTYIGEVGSDEVNALADSSDTFFTQEQGEYAFEWSDYAIINGNHYWRYLDEIWAGDISKKNNYFDIINWDYEITGDFMNEFVPASDESANNRLLLNINNFLIKVAETVTKASAETVDSFTGFEATWTRPTFAQGNANLVNNLKAAAQAIISLAPQHIFGSDYATNERCYYDLLVAEDNNTVLTGIAAMVVDLVMPSMTLPGKTEILNSGATVGAILAAVVREFAAQLIPEYNFDALIYADFGTTTSDPNKSFLTGKDNNYWLDVLLTMGINIGLEYIRAFADMGEGSDEWNAFVAYSGYAPEGKTYEAMTTAQLNAHWEGILDYVVDWALEKDYEWTWKMENLVKTTGLTIDLKTAQDPWQKLDTILFGLIPFDEILSITTNDTYPTRVEKFLRYDLILGLVELRWADLLNIVNFNGTNNYFRTGNILDTLAKLVKGIVNGIFAKVGNANGNFKLIPDVITDFDTLANQSNIATMATNLVGALYTALVTNKLADTALPFLNMFLGWKTDPQVIAPIQTWTAFRDGNDYAFQWVDNGVYPTMDANNTIIKVLNNSAGMLEKHRNSSVTDHAYEISITGVTSDATVNTLTFTYDATVSPYETIDIKVGGTYKGEEAVTVTIAYEYVGKDGQPVGGTQYTSISFLVSNQYEDANIEGRKSGDDSDGKYGIDPFKAFQFTEDIYTTVTTFQPAVWGTNPTIGGGTSNFHWVAAPASDSAALDCNKNLTGNDNPVNMNATASTYFAYYQNQDGGFADSFPKDGSTSGKLYYAKSGVTANTEFPYGLYDMGQVAISYSDDVKFWKIDYIYYNDYDIYDVYTENSGNGYNANQGVDPAIYNEYNSAWKDIVKYATYPMMTEGNGNASTDYVKTIQPKIPAALERFEEAKEAYVEALAEAQALGSSAAIPGYVQAVEAQLALDGGNGEPEINFQDYEYYEYFNYADLRTAARTLVAAYYAPEVMDTYYIRNSGIREAELNALIEAEENAAIAAAITASRLENDQAAIDASIAAVDAWQMPTNDPISVEDIAARLAYYKTFVNDSVKEDPDHKYFLDLEIAHIDAQQLNAADYEAVTWGRFQEAYDYATEVSAGTAENSDLNSIIFQAKWGLMVKYKELLKKADSLIEAGGTATLGETILAAEAIFEIPYADITLSDAGLALAEDPAEAKDIALGHLIQGLGYYYTGEDGNQWNLYADSAYEYRDNDRPNKQGNQAKVDACNANLEACIAYFAVEVAAPELEAVDGTTGAFGNVVEEDGVVTGYIYGVSAGTSVETNFKLTDDSAGYTKKVASALKGASENGTGAKVQVYNNSDVMVAEYTLIIFGDVDGSATVNAADITDITLYTQNAGSFGADSLFAANVNGDAATNAADITDITLFTQNAGSLSVNPYA